MRIDEIVWIEQTIEKLERKHAVSVEEVEQVLFGLNRTFRAERGRVEGDDLYVAYGQTDSGRYVIVFYIGKATGQAIVISARDQTANERQRFMRK